MRRFPVVAAVAVALAGCGPSHHHAAKAPPAGNPATTITVSVSRCGTGWTHPAVGHQSFGCY